MSLLRPGSAATTRKRNSPAGGVPVALFVISNRAPRSGASVRDLRRRVRDLRRREVLICLPCGAFLFCASSDVLALPAACLRRKCPAGSVPAAQFVISNRAPRSGASVRDLRSREVLICLPCGAFLFCASSDVLALRAACLRRKCPAGGVPAALFVILNRAPRSGASVRDLRRRKVLICLSCGAFLFCASSDVLALRAACLRRKCPAGSVPVAQFVISNRAPRSGASVRDLRRRKVLICLPCGAFLFCARSDRSACGRL